MITDEPPNDIVNPNSFEEIAGIIVSRASAIDPINVILVATFAK